MAYIKKNIILSGIVGNILGQYENIILGFMAHYIFLSFFPPTNEINGVLKVFYVFVIGYAARPIGGLLFGFLSDYWGRKKTLIFSILLMGLATTAIGILPSYNTIGSAAILLLLLCRLFQGLAVGGEYITSLTFLLEHAPAGQSGFMVCWAAFGVNSGNLIASFLSFIIIFAMSHFPFPDWIWRIVFLIPLVGAAFGIWIRTQTSETLPFIRENSTQITQFGKQHWLAVLETLQTRKKEAFLIFILTSLGTCATYLIYLYAPLHAVLLNHLPAWKAYAANSIAIIFLIALLPLFGYLSDNYGRKIFLLLSTGIFLIFAYPFFWTASHGTLVSFVMMQLFLSVGVASFHSIAPVVIVEIMPVKIRCTISAFLYGLAASLFGTTSPTIALTLVKYTKNALSPSYYLIIFSVIGLIAIAMLLKEPTNVPVEIKT